MDACGEEIGFYERIPHMDKSTDTPRTLQEIINWVKSLEIKHSLKHLCRVLLDYMGPNRVCWPSLKRIAADIGVHHITISRWLSALAKLGIIRIAARYRDCGGRTSNYYSFVFSGPLSPKAKTKSIQCKKTKTHAEDGLSRKITNKSRAQYLIEPATMHKASEAFKHYKIALSNRWIESDARSLISYFSCWAKAMRLYRTGKAERPGALFNWAIKSKLLHRWPSNTDEDKALKVIRGLKIQGLL